MFFYAHVICFWIAVEWTYFAFTIFPGDRRIASVTFKALTEAGRCENKKKLVKCNREELDNGHVETCAFRPELTGAPKRVHFNTLQKCHVHSNCSSRFSYGRVQHASCPVYRRKQNPKYRTPFTSNNLQFLKSLLCAAHLKISVSGTFSIVCFVRVD